ncbi:MAG: PKD domain-containing protein, partial [Candidatus Zixiibacteriota bacterium]
ELWKSDGTTAGTVMLKDIVAGTGSSAPFLLTAVGSTLYFTAYDPTNGIELWRSDGTPGGTVMVKGTVSTGGALTGVVQVTADGWMVYGNADVTAGAELWVTDGTAANTFMLQDIFPGVGSSNPNGFMVAGSNLYFTANDGLTGVELWSMPLSSFDRGAFSVTANATLIGEAAGTATFTVTRTGFFGATTVDFATVEGSAVAGSDFTAVGGTLSFAHGETSKTVTVPIVDDSLNEGDETFSLDLSNPTNGATLGTPSTAAVTIVDNDPVPSVSVGPASITEGDSGTAYMQFSISMSGASGQTVQVAYATSDITATSFSDYLPTSGVATFLPGSTQQTVLVPVFGDVLNEPDETFNFILSFPLHAVPGSMDAVGTIVDDDPVPVVTLDGPYNATEGQAVFMTASVGSSKGPIASYAWDFGDGTTGSGNPVSHTYAQQGSYTVSVTVTDSYGISGLTTTTAGILDTAPTPSFTMDVSAGPAPLTVNFSDTSTAYDGVVGWSWDFGDSYTSTAQNPSHTYTTAG